MNSSGLDKILNPETGKVGIKILRDIENKNNTNRNEDMFEFLHNEITNYIFSFLSNETNSLGQTDHLKYNLSLHLDSINPNPFYYDFDLSRKDNIRYQNSNLLHFVNIKGKLLIDRLKDVPNM